MKLETYKKLESYTKISNRRVNKVIKITPWVLIGPMLLMLFSMKILHWKPDPIEKIIVYSMGPGFIFVSILLLWLIADGVVSLCMMTSRNKKIKAYVENEKLAEEKERLENRARKIIIAYEMDLSKIATRVEEIKKEMKKNEEVINNGTI